MSNISPSEFGQYLYSDGTSVQDFIATSGLGAAVERAITEGVIPARNKEIPMEVAEIKQAALEDMLKAREVFYGRLPVLSEQGDLLIGENELIKADDVNALEEYQVVITIPNILEIFSGILGFPVSFENESEAEAFISGLLADLPFEEYLFLLVSNSEKNIITKPVSGVDTKIPLESRNFSVENITYENDTLIITTRFTVQE